MTIWIKDDSEKVHLGISGDVSREHIEFLQMKILDRIHSGYRRIIIDMNRVRTFDSHGLDMLKQFHLQVATIGVQLVIEDEHGIVKQ